MLIAISESRRPRRNSVRYPVNAGLNELSAANQKKICYFEHFGFGCVKNAIV
jgi:hypothetical protein